MSGGGPAAAAVAGQANAMGETATTSARQPMTSSPLLVSPDRHYRRACPPSSATGRLTQLSPAGASPSPARGRVKHESDGGGAPVGGGRLPALMLADRLGRGRRRRRERVSLHPSALTASTARLRVGSPEARSAAGVAKAHEAATARCRKGQRTAAVASMMIGTLRGEGFARGVADLALGSLLLGGVAAAARGHRREGEDGGRDALEHRPCMRTRAGRRITRAG